MDEAGEASCQQGRRGWPPVQNMKPKKGIRDGSIAAHVAYGSASAIVPYISTHRRPLTR